jgi:hypothetical protein
VNTEQVFTRSVARVIHLCTDMARRLASWRYTLPQPAADGKLGAGLQLRPVCRCQSVQQRIIKQAVLVQHSLVESLGADAWETARQVIVAEDRAEQQPLRD